MRPRRDKREQWTVIRMLVRRTSCHEIHAHGLYGLDPWIWLHFVEMKLLEPLSFMITQHFSVEFFLKSYQFFSFRRLSLLSAPWRCQTSDKLCTAWADKATARLKLEVSYGWLAKHWQDISILSHPLTIAPMSNIHWKQHRLRSLHLSSSLCIV